MKFYIGLGISCIVFIIIGVTGFSGDALLTTLVQPFIWLGDGLRYLSLKGGFLNVLSVFIFIVVTMIPILYMVYLILKKKNDVLDFIFLGVLSISLGRTLYLFINPHILFNSMNEMIINNTPVEQVPTLELVLTSGAAYIFYAILLIYLVYKAYNTELMNGIDYFRALINITIYIFAFAVLAIGLSSTIQTYNSYTVGADQEVVVFKYISEFVTTSLLIYLLILFKDFVIEVDKDGFQPSLLTSIAKISKLSFGLLITILSFQLLINVIQMATLDQMLNFHFSLDIPIAEMLIISIILIVSKYINKIIEVKEENELFI